MKTKNKTMRNKLKAVMMVAFMMGVGALLSGCLSEPTFMNQGKIQLKKTTYRTDFATREVTQDVANGVGVAYERGGEGPVSVTVTYDPYHKSNDAMNATRSIADITRNLRKAGIPEVKTEILPAYRSGDVSETFISFRKYNAERPDDCQDMPGLHGNNANLSRDYKLGCGLDEMIARQVHNPKDLLGSGGFEGLSDGRRQGNIVETYRTGVPNEALDGETASE